MNSQWLCIKAEFQVPKDDWAVVHEIFQRHGCSGTEEHALPPTMSGYLFVTENLNYQISGLGKDLLDLGACSVLFTVIPEENWSESWKEFFKPREIGKSFFLVPSWEECEIPEGKSVIILDPGQAFGTGEHATTQMCLSMLEACVQENDVVCDLGTGSGILSIVAKKLNAKKVYATESDYQAFLAAKNNFQINNVQVDLFHTEEIPEQIQDCDVVVSNIISATLIRIAPFASRIVKRDGVWIISGVIEANWQAVHDAIVEKGFELISKRTQDDWVAGSFRKL